MTSRERYRAAINHREPDRVPIDCGQDMHNGIHEVAYAKLINHLGLNEEITIYDPMQRLAVASEDVLNRLHVDTRYIFANGNKNFEMIIEPDGSYEDEFGVRRERCGHYCDNVRPPLANASRREIMNHKFPDPDEPSRYAGLRERAKKMYDETDYALIAGSPGSLFFLSAEFRGFEKYMEELASDPGTIELLVDRTTEWTMAFMDHYLGEIGDYIELMWFGDDWGCQSGPIMNPEIMRKMFVPRYRKLIEFMKSKTRAKLCLHCCGAVMWAIDNFIDMGVDVLHPVQADAAEMGDPKLLKERFGDRLVFYANMPNQTIVPHGTPNEVRRAAIERIKYLAPGGGYVFSMGHNIQADVPPENVLAGFDTAYECGGYPIDL